MCVHCLLVSSNFVQGELYFVQHWRVGWPDGHAGALVGRTATHAETETDSVAVILEADMVDLV
jgi:hypothetical protein